LERLPKPLRKKPEGWIPKPGESRDPKPVMALPKDKDGKVRHWKTLDEELKPVKEPFSEGSRVLIKGGPHSGLKATVSLKQGTNAIVILPSDERVVVGLSNLSQIDGYSDTPQTSSRSSSKHHKNSKTKKTSDKRKSKKNKKRKLSPSPSPHKKLSSTASGWITPDIRVKICTKSLAEGRYYCKYAWIIDILPGNCCVVRVENEGDILEGVRQEDLETSIPSVGGRVRLVRGEFCGELGVVFDKDGEKGTVFVQLEEDLEIHKMGYDDVAEYRRE